MEKITTDLLKAYTEEEVRDALNQMHTLKAPRPDGMNLIFFQCLWLAVGN